MYDVKSPTCESMLSCGVRNECTNDETRTSNGVNECDYPRCFVGSLLSVSGWVNLITFTSSVASPSRIAARFTGEKRRYGSWYNCSCSSQAETRAGELRATKGANEP